MSGINPDLPVRRALFRRLVRHSFSDGGSLGEGGFTLLEVVVAIGIFAIGMVAVIGLFGPVAKSVGDIADAEAATHVAELLSFQLQAQEAADLAAGTPFQSLVKCLMVSTGKSHQLTLDDTNPNYNVADPAQNQNLMFASRDGTKIGAYSDAVWGGTDHDKFFEIALIRNETLSPVAGDTATPPPLVLAYTARVRWPAFVALAGSPSGFQPGQGAPGAVVPFDYSQKRVLFFAGTVTR
jgi:prepilin-type N-terminal cleavage/methylation domain-containing protein